MHAATSLRLFLDLGDVFTKALVDEDGQRRRLRFPSVVAHRLLNDGAPATDLLLDEQQELPRPVGFEGGQYPRSRSYPGAAPIVEAARPVPRARFAGWIAAAHGADREMLGVHPTEDNVDALVHKVLLASSGRSGSAWITFVIDQGPKCAAIQSWVGATPRAVRFLRWTVGRSEPLEVELDVRADVVDAADCARAALGPETGLPRDCAVLLLDVGYLRTKLAVISPEGCERQEELPGVGVASLVRRILRDGQDQGLVEDELAVVRALELSQETIEVRGRRFDVRGPVAQARRALEEELERAVLRAAADHFSRHGEPCGGLAIAGGGAHLVGPALAARLEGAGLAPAPTWVATDGGHLIVEGAALGASGD